MTLAYLLSVWGISLLLALIAVGVLTPALRRLLTDLCGTQERASFWALYAALMVVLAPLMAVSMPGLLDASASGGEIGPVLQRAVFYSLAGIVAALMVMGYAVWRPIAAMTAPGKTDAL